MSKTVYLVYCQYYCEPYITKALFDEEEAYKYAKERNEKLESNSAYYVDDIEVY